MELVDTHAHLDEQAFEADLVAAVQRAMEAGVTRIVSIGTTVESSRATLRIADKFPSVWAAVGIHPNYALKATATDWEQIIELAQHPRVVALGETGLDRFWNHTPIEIQADYFDRHLALTRQTGKPFIVHCRDAEADVLAQLTKEYDTHGPLHGVMHSFCGSLAAAERYLAMGLYISFSGMVTIRRNEELRQLSALIPVDRMLVETDCPYLAPTPYRGKRNEPSYVKFTASTLAEQLGIDLEELATRTTANAKRLFAW